MEHYIGGYYLVEGTPIKNWMNAALLPDTIWSTSDCICNLHPAASALPWVRGKREKEEYRKKLNLRASEFNYLQENADELFNDEKLGWNSVFIKIDDAINFKNIYLSQIPNIKLLMVATTEKYRTLFLDEEKPKGNEGMNGSYHSLKRGIFVEKQKYFRGYDILGYEFGGFHSFMCNSLEENISVNLNINLNENGLIESYGAAERATNYISDPDIGAEPVSWMPWAIYDIPLPETKRGMPTCLSASGQS